MPKTFSLPYNSPCENNIFFHIIVHMEITFIFLSKLKLFVTFDVIGNEMKKQVTVIFIALLRHLLVFLNLRSLEFVNMMEA